VIPDARPLTESPSSVAENRPIPEIYFAPCSRRVKAVEQGTLRLTPQVHAKKRVCCLTLTPDHASASMRPMAKPQKSSANRGKPPARSSSKQKKQKALAAPVPQRGGVEMVDPRVQAQMKVYEEAMALFHQQKFQRAKQELEKVLEGPSKELADRARMHLRIVEQRMKPSADQNPKSPEDHYQRGVAMMNLGRWDEARESLEKARKLAPKLDHVHYALAALDCLTGEADSAMANLKVAIELRPANRYHARNDEDFAFLQEDPRFTELLYPEKEGYPG
jgi:tetratricopeptide (TPR) repeat protein